MDAVIFDLDGTLLDSEKTILRSLNTALEEFGFTPFEMHELHSMIGMDLHRILARKGADQPIIVQRYTQVQLDTFMDDMTWYNGVPELLTNLQESGYVLAAATMRRGRVARAVLNGLGLNHHFDAIVGADDAPEPKPSGAHLLKTCESIGVEPDDAIMVGDSKYDILSAKAAGCLAIGVSWGMGSSKEMEDAGAEHIIHEMNVLSDFLLMMI
ncbi:MAG: HAD family hydrolase [Thermoplasmata archaeon]|nr:HAD family hydrolase [Thermoplasmata archaeon]